MYIGFARTLYLKAMGLKDESVNAFYSFFGLGGFYNRRANSIFLL